MELLISGPAGASRKVGLKKDELSLGRAADNDLAYPDDPWLSRYHLRFEKQGRHWLVKDCASRNGTILNAKTLTEPHRVAVGDRINAGHLMIEVRDSSSERSSRVVSFVPQRQELLARESTFVTNLETVLGKTGDQGPLAKETTLSSVRVIRALIKAGQELAGHNPLEKVFSIILDLALSAVNAKRGVILTLEDGELVVRASKGEGFSISTAVRDRILTNKDSLMISDAMLDAAFREQKSIVAQRVRSIIAVPLQTGDRVIGILYVDSGMLANPFSQEDLDLLTVMANVAAIRIEHARLALVEQSEKLMESEFSQASELQRSLLPTEVPVCEGYDLAGFNLSCRTVGGDYYDFLPYTDGRLALIVGDVSGKGLPAALMMSSLQARVHMLAETNPDPAVAVTTLNRNTAARCPLGKFITFFYGLLDPAAGKLRYANAGHNYPLLVRANGAVKELRGNGMVLGIMADSQYQAHEVDLKPGDTLALYSDGVTEARTQDEQQIEFGEQRLAQFLAGNLGTPLNDIIDRLVDTVRHWSGQTALADDFTIVLVRRAEKHAR